MRMAPGRSCDPTQPLRGGWGAGYLDLEAHLKIHRMSEGCTLASPTTAHIAGHVSRVFLKGGGSKGCGGTPPPQETLSC